jgi:hypothetical protein
VPYSTCEVESSSVVQVITAELAVKLPEFTAEITGGVVSAVAVIVIFKSADLVTPPSV